MMNGVGQDDRRATLEQLQQAVRECCASEERANIASEVIRANLKTEEWNERIERMVRIAIAEFQTRAVILDKAIEALNENAGSVEIPSFKPCRELELLLLFETLILNDTDLSLVTSSQSTLTNGFLKAVKDNNELLVSFLLMESLLPSSIKEKAFAESIKNGLVSIVDLLITKGDVDPSIHDNWAIKTVSEKFESEMICRLLLDKRVVIPPILYKQIASRPFNALLTERILDNPSLNVEQILLPIFPPAGLNTYTPSFPSELIIRLLEDSRFTATEQMLFKAIELKNSRLLEICIRTIVPTTDHLKSICNSGSLANVQLLLEDGRAMPTFEMLMNSCNSGYARIAHRLLQDPRIAFTDELFIPICRNGLNTVFDQIMLDRRIEPTFRAFLTACEHNNLYIVERLLQDGRIYPFCNNYQALKLARTKGYNKIVELLINDPRYDSFEISEEVAVAPIPEPPRPDAINIGHLAPAIQQF